MIASINGTLRRIEARSAIVEIGGIGYKVFASAPTLTTLRANQDQPVFLFTHLVVREDALDLYGFLDRLEQEYFELLIGVSGIGPKSALAILSVAPPETLRKAVVAEDTTYLTKVSGIGRKSADKIVIELRDKLGAIESGDSAQLKQAGEAMEALRSLGYNDREAREALNKVPADITDTGAIIKEVLKHLGK